MSRSRSPLAVPSAPHERGVQHGEAFADEIRHNVRTYLDTFEGRDIDTGPSTTSTT